MGFIPTIILTLLKKLTFITFQKRSTLTAGFSTKQLNEMIPVFDDVLDRFIKSLKNLNQEPVDMKLVGSKFAVDAFTSASFRFMLVKIGSIKHFKHCGYGPKRRYPRVR